jgi:predicted AAA+ superfamily ATPase
MKEIFKKLIIDSQEREFGELAEREYQIPPATRKIVSLIGVRRSGKTSLLFKLIQTLRQQVGRENIAYINFEDDRLYPIVLKDLDEFITAFYERYPETREEKIYLFFDEIQGIKGWELFVRRLHDTLNVQLFITGSSSRLLSSEIATSLRGRTIAYEIFPFSFKEYLGYKNIAVNLHSSRSISFIRHAWNSYLTEGGFAETFDETKDVQQRILKDYMDLIIYRDIIDRYAIKNRSLLKHLIKYFFVNMGTLVSFNKLYNEYKSLGYKVGKDTLYDYISYLQEAYTLFTIPIYRNSVRQELRNPRKLYAIDNGFRQLFDASLSRDYSKLYENLAFLHLRRKGPEIYYFKQKQEVDFYTRQDGEQLVNVSYCIEDATTFKREITALVEGMQYFNLEKSYLVTAEREEIVQTEAGEVLVLPMWKWLLA